MNSDNFNDDDFAERRSEMVREQIEQRGIKEQKVLQAFLRVPRHLFVEERIRSRAYDDYPLPIGEEQTISQPYTVAFMTDALKLAGTERVLEIGSGSGYQTAILLEIVKEVYCLERIASLAAKAKNTLTKLGYSGFEIRVADGTTGWEERAPFDAIIVAAGSPKVPDSLMGQLAIGGRLVIPVGDRYSQTMTRVTRLSDVEYNQEDLGGFRFVGLIGKEGWAD